MTKRTTAGRCDGFVAIISDMHLAPDYAGSDRQQNPCDLPQRRTRHLESVLAEITAGPRPAAVLFGGDNANQPVSRPDYRRYAHGFMKRFPAPCYAIPGNHDVGSTVGWHHHDPDELAAACRAFREDWDDWWLLETAGFRIMGVNTQIFGSGLADEAEQSAWLSKRLSEPGDKLRVVFAHTPPYLKTPEDDFADGSEQMCLKPQARRPFLDVLNESPPDLLITTHAHRYWICNQQRWDWLGIPATALGQDEQIKVPSHNLPPGDDRVGWVALYRDGCGWVAEMRCCRKS